MLNEASNSSLHNRKIKTNFLISYLFKWAQNGSYLEG